MANIRLKRDNTVLVGIDYQERLVPAMSGKEELIETAAKLIKGFEILGMPVILTQQYPKGLGQTIPEIKDINPNAQVIDKAAFSAWEDEGFIEAFKKTGRNVAVVMGIETHVCEQQTVLDMIDEGYTVYVPVDCVASRKNLDRDTAIERMRQAGAIITTYESVLFELLVTSKVPEFKAISSLVK